MASPFSSPEYMAYLAQRKRSMGAPFARSHAYSPPGPTPVVGAGGGTGTTPGTSGLHPVGGETWEMNSNRDGVQFNGPSQYSGRSAGGDTGERIHGYSGGGIPTNLFSQLTGRGPTAADAEALNGGGLSPQFNQMGSLDSYYALQRNPSQWQQLQMRTPQAGSDPMAGVMGNHIGNNQLVDRTQGPGFRDMDRTPIASPIPSSSPFTGKPWTAPDPWEAQQAHVMTAADGGNIPAGQPVIVGERGPEMVVPTKDSTVIPHEYLPLQHLMQGNILEYLKRFMR